MLPVVSTLSVSCPSCERPTHHQVLFIDVFSPVLRHDASYEVVYCGPLWVSLGRIHHSGARPNGTDYCDSPVRREFKISPFIPQSLLWSARMSSEYHVVGTFLLIVGNPMSIYAYLPPNAHASLVNSGNIAALPRRRITGR